MKLYFQNHPKYKKLFTDYYLNHVEFWDIIIVETWGRSCILF
jgi:hypothetical protein